MLARFPPNSNRNRGTYVLQTTNQPLKTHVPERQGATADGDLESIRDLRPDEPSSKSTINDRSTRYRLQDESRRLLLRYQQETGLDKPERTVFCCRSIVPGCRHVEIRYSEGRGKASYGNLMTCGSLWGCPVCAARITEQRRQELTEMVNKWGRSRVYLVTLTMSHHQGERLLDLLDALYGNSRKKRQGALRRLKSGRQWRGFTEYYEIVGNIRASEITHGDNGWHPHIHMILVGKVPWTDDTLIEMQGLLGRLWMSALEKEGRSCSVANGCRITRGAAEYVTKEWAVEHELTKQPTKRARDGGRSPLELLHDSCQGDTKAGNLWLEYYFSMKGRAQLVWSRGLRDLMGLNTQPTDEELAASEEPDMEVVATLTTSQWHEVVSKKIRADILEQVEIGKLHSLRLFLRQHGIPDVGMRLVKKPPGG